jgi:deazaflavin-dependent oxidoreductase (nitroreductase family)
MGMIIALLATIVVGLVALAGVFIGGMRAKWPPVTDRVRGMNRRFLNPREMEDAGKPGAFAEVLRHTGRTTGQVHETPMTILPTDDGFVIALVYGRRTQWLKNVLAAGRAEVVREGVTYAVDRPEVVSTNEMAPYFSRSDQRMSSLLRVDECLRLYHAELD